ncbi:MAG TPA: hypothetical protein VFK45_07775 [Gammaproteobacteria bacterium]|nr:hypothetical protein [Gammaproteobacteria bacterium]
MRRKRQQGFALVLAVFVITVLAALGAYILTISGVQHQTSVLTLQQTRALNAARAGVEWLSYQVVTNQACPAAASLADFQPGAPGLSAFTVSGLTCTQSTHKIGGDDINLYVIEATATAGSYGTPDFVSRHVRRIVSGAAP